jgi:hypothetical protein
VHSAPRAQRAACTARAARKHLNACGAATSADTTGNTNIKEHTDSDDPSCTTDDAVNAEVKSNTVIWAAHSRVFHRDKQNYRVELPTASKRLGPKKHQWPEQHPAIRDRGAPAQHGPGPCPMSLTSINIDDPERTGNRPPPPLTTRDRYAPNALTDY